MDNPSRNHETYTARIGPVLRHGNGLAQPVEPTTAAGRSGAAAAVPFSLPGELVALEPVGSEPRTGDAEVRLLRVLEPSPERVEPGCPHFGACGGCHLQMASAPGQLRLKQAVLLDWLRRAGIRDLPAAQVHSDEPWGYRNRIRVRVGPDTGGALRLGYNERASRRFLPVSTCPISAPLLWRTAEALLATTKHSPQLDSWLSSTAEVELFADAALDHLQLLLLLERAPPAKPDITFAQAMDALKSCTPELAGAGAMLLGPSQRSREGIRDRQRTTIASWGAAGLAYTVGSGRGVQNSDKYWITRGSFFQVNRFLLPTLVRLVCAGHSGKLAWDLFAGVGLFARPLARSFARVTAVEGNPLAARDLQAALAQAGGQHQAVPAATLDFLRASVLQRERPDLITLDPPRAGAGEAACELLVRLAAPEVVYVSCDPETLARDLAVLQRGYRLAELHLVDMFPQTYHQETVVVLQRRAKENLTS